MKKTKRDIHKEIMYNKIMPTGHMKRNGFEEYADENEDSASPAVTFPEKAEVDPAELTRQTVSEERKAMMAEEERREAKKIDSENENIVKILSEKEKQEETDIHEPPQKADEEKFIPNPPAEDEETAEPEQKSIPLPPEPPAPIPKESAPVPKAPLPEIKAEDVKPKPQEPAPVIPEPPAAPSNPIIEQMTADDEEVGLPSADSVIDDILKTVSGKSEEQPPIEEKPAPVPEEKPEPPKPPAIPEKKPVLPEKKPAEPVHRKLPENNIPKPVHKPELPKKSEPPKVVVPPKPRIPEKKENFSVDDILSEIPQNRYAPKAAAKVQLPELVNINEVMINNKIDGILEKFNCCKCPACKLEVIATALNKLSPQYVIKKNESTVPDAIAASNYAKINSALINAIITLRANPIHK